MSPIFARVRKLSPWVAVLISAAIAVAAYLQALNYGFAAEDTNYTVDNARLYGLHVTELWRLFTEPYNIFSEFLPLREFSFWMDMTLFGMSPSTFRLDNIVLFLLCLPLVYGSTLWLWRYFRPIDAVSAPWAAATVTALFALHPSHAEAVVWISGRKDVLSTLFSMLALWFALNAKREHGFTMPYAIATLLALLAAMLSKASAVAVAPVIALLWLMFWHDMPEQKRRISMLLWPLASLILAASIAIIFASITTQRIPFYFGVEVITRTLAVLGWLARLAVSPESRHFFYPVLDDPYLPVMIVLGALVLAVVTVSAMTILKKRSLEGFTLVAFFLLCLPSLQLIPYSPPSLVSDRWLAFSMWPILLLIVALAWRLQPKTRIIILLIIASSYCFQTIERTRDWRSFSAVTDADVRAFPWYYIPAIYKIVNQQITHGLVLEARETANNISEPKYRQLMTNYIDAEYAVHVDAIATSNPQKAVDLLWKLGLDIINWPEQAKWNPVVVSIYRYLPFAITHEWQFLHNHFPNDISINYNFGLWSLNIKDYKQAAAQLGTAVESQQLPEPVRGTAYKNLGFALFESGGVTKAEAPLRAALEQSPPDFRAYCLLSYVYKHTGRLEEATRAEANCIKLVPSEKLTQ